MNDLFGVTNNYESTTVPDRRPFQVDAHERLRQGLRDEHRCQIIMAPTGAGTCLRNGTLFLMVDCTMKNVPRNSSRRRRACLEVARQLPATVFGLPSATAVGILVGAHRRYPGGIVASWSERESLAVTRPVAQRQGFANYSELERQHECMDTRAARKTVFGHPRLEALGAFDGATNRGGQDAIC